ncbi:MAG: DUF5615 family PIN-like protein, partial [Candidatus Micrarchaeaceae archaeon]
MEHTELKFLIDANISPHVCEMIRSYGHVATQVFDIRLSSDLHILKRAIDKDYVLVTRDSDFQQLIDTLTRRHEKLPRGLVMIKGETRKEQRITNESLETAIRSMLEWLN